MNFSYIYKSISTNIYKLTSRLGYRIFQKAIDSNLDRVTLYHLWSILWLSSVSTSNCRSITTFKQYTIAIIHIFTYFYSWPSSPISIHCLHLLTTHGHLHLFLFMAFTYLLLLSIFVYLLFIAIFTFYSTFYLCISSETESGP